MIGQFGRSHSPVLPTKFRMSLNGADHLTLGEGGGGVG